MENYSDKKIRVCAYCRVSTEQDEQLHSLEAQKRYFEEYIIKNVLWEFVGIYADEGITGTNINKRKAFKQMLEDAEQHKFNLLLTKEISRFARNTLDSIQYTRHLKNLGIGVIFINDNINTLDPDSELRLTIMASIAQEESRKTSERVKWGIKRSMENGFVLGSNCYGYYLTNGVLTVNEEQAKVVRKIFEMYKEGAGVRKISKTLESEGIPSPAGLHHWKNTSLLKMLANEKYIGTLKQKKEITIDYLTHKKILNDGREDFIIIENHHTPIVDTQLFNDVQEALKRRHKMAENKSKYSNKYAFSTKVICGECGSIYHRRGWNGKNDKRHIVWQCKESVRNDKKKVSAFGETIGCDNKGIHETILEGCFLNALNSLVLNKQNVSKIIKSIVYRAINQAKDNTNEIKLLKASIEKIEAKKGKLIDLYVTERITREQFDFNDKQYSTQLEGLFTSLNKLESENKSNNDLKGKLSEIDNLVDSICCCDEFSEEVCKKILDKVIVYSRDRIDFYFKLKDNADFPIPFCITPDLYRLCHLYHPYRLFHRIHPGRLCRL
ncbi:recombinase family protein [Lachnospiraceae bacterium NSJ-143]|nr:recombinase family protein [Lachnospiraceae bacterium NSJ-143]